MNKKILAAAITSGLLLSAGLWSIGAAQPSPGPNGAWGPPPGHHRMGGPMNGAGPGHHPMGPRMSDEDIAARAAEIFGVEKAEVAAYLAENPRAFREVFHGSMLARTSGRSFAEVIALYTEQEDWRAVENTLGVTKEMIHETMGELMADRIADEKTNLTKEEAQALLREGYHPRDIRSAGILGRAANRSARDVLALKRINNRWDDVAQELGLDSDILREAFRPGWMMGGPVHPPRPTDH